MKSIHFILLTVLFSAFMVSCSKSDKASAPVTIEGTWKGTYSVGNGPSDKFFGIVLKANGVFEEVDAAGITIGIGEWEMENDIITATYDRISPSDAQFSVIAAFYKNQGSLEGNWGYGTSATDGGNFSLKKQ